MTDTIYVWATRIQEAAYLVLAADKAEAQRMIQAAVDERYSLSGLHYDVHERDIWTITLTPGTVIEIDTQEGTS